MEVAKLISPQDAAAAGENVTIWDVRTPAEYAEVHAVNARNVPLDELDPERLPKAGPYYVICQSGGRARKACEKLLAAGRVDVFNIEGGTKAWVAAGMPVVRGRKMMSLERQVRIAAGSLVLIGVGLSLFVHPYCVGLSAFIGAGLVFAGITDTCGMGMMLAKMPWNRRPPQSCAVATTQQVS